MEDRAQGLEQLDELQAGRRGLQSALSAYFYRVLSHCIWSGCLINPMTAIAITYTRLSFWNKEL